MVLHDGWRLNPGRDQEEPTVLEQSDLVQGVGEHLRRVVEGEGGVVSKQGAHRVDGLDHRDAIVEIELEEVEDRGGVACSDHGIPKGRGLWVGDVALNV